MPTPPSIPELLRAFDRELQSGHDWIQAYYTVSNPDESWRTRLLTYTFSLINGVMPLGKSRLGLGGAFKGNGMCFSVNGLNRIPWRSHGLVEDMEFSWAVRLAGEKIVFLPDVSVYGAMLVHGGAPAASQRRRWEFGRKEIRKIFLPSASSLKPFRSSGRKLHTCSVSLADSIAGWARRLVCGRRSGRLSRPARLVAAPSSVHSSVLVRLPWVHVNHTRRLRNHSLSDYAPSVALWTERYYVPGLPHLEVARHLPRPSR